MSTPKTRFKFSELPPEERLAFKGGPIREGWIIIQHHPSRFVQSLDLFLSAFFGFGTSVIIIYLLTTSDWRRFFEYYEKGEYFAVFITLFFAPILLLPAFSFNRNFFRGIAKLREAMRVPELNANGRMAFGLLLTETHVIYRDWQPMEYTVLRVAREHVKPAELGWRPKFKNYTDPDPIGESGMVAELRLMFLNYYKAADLASFVRDPIPIINGWLEKA